MGYEKNKMIEYEDRGYGHSEKYFCADCFGDKFLKRYISRYGSKGQCSFCKNSSGRAVERNVVLVDEIMEILSEVIHRDYKSALDWAIYDPEEERYWELVLDPYEFVRDELNQYMGCENDNRMSEKGDMMFYGSFEEEVALKEIGVEDGQLVTIGRFHTNKEIRVLDLTEFTDCELKSIFDVENSDKRSMWFFVKNFIQSISGEKDETKKDFYKPTQVFTKYVQRKTRLQGIVYHSAKFSIQEINGIPQYRKNVVLFVENRDCLEQGDMTDKHRMQLIMEPEPKQYVYKEG